MAIKIKVYAPGFINHKAIDQYGYVELLENDSVGSLYHKLEIPLPLRAISPCFVNYEQAKSTTILKNGDVVTFIFPIAGG